jgi:hypothetical protein
MSVEKELTGVWKSVNENHARIVVLEERVAGTRALVDQRFSDLDERFDDLSSRLSSMNKVLTGFFLSTISLLVGILITLIGG